MEDRERARMVERQLVRRGISDVRVLAAFRDVPREAFVSENLEEVAYEDSPLPIGEGQTISQPFVVALTLEALELRGVERVLEIGTGSGYSAALLGRLAREVYTVERIPSLARAAAERLAAFGAERVRVVCADGSLGLPEHAPYDAIAVAAAGPRVPERLLEQLATGGRLVMPVGGEEGQRLVRVTRYGEHELIEEKLLDVSFVPLIGAAAWPEPRTERGAAEPPGPEAAAVVRRAAEPFRRDEPVPVASLLERIGDARVVLLGCAMDGAAELQRARVEITEALLAVKGFDLVAVDGDWIDGARVDEHVRGRAPRAGLPLSAFARFPEVRYRNREVDAFVDRLREHDADVGFHALDVLGTSAALAVALERLEETDPERAADVKRRWASLSPWRRGATDLVGGDAGRALEDELVETLGARARASSLAAREDGQRLGEAARRACADPERYFRRLLEGELDAWSMRTEHMADVLRALLADRDPASRAIVWTSDAQVADARATETGVRGHRTLGQLCRATFGGDAYLVGMGADHGAVLASPAWGTPPRRVALRPAAERSYEHLFHEAGHEAFLLALRDAAPPVRRALRAPRLARYVGAVYKPERELATHYLYASLPAAFDEIVFFDRVTPIEPIGVQPTCDPDAAHPLHG
jgi:protein-L-isoaspartate(D-aspartate) O-methyltransferase